MGEFLSPSYDFISVTQPLAITTEECKIRIVCAEVTKLGKIDDRQTPIMDFEIDLG